LKIGLDLKKLLPKVWWHPFFGTWCSIARLHKMSLVALQYYMQYVTATESIFMQSLLEYR